MNKIGLINAIILQIVPFRLRFKCKMQDKAMDDYASQACSPNLRDYTSDDLIWYARLNFKHNFEMSSWPVPDNSFTSTSLHQTRKNKFLKRKIIWFILKIFFMSNIKSSAGFSDPRAQVQGLKAGLSEDICLLVILIPK